MVRSGLMVDEEYHCEKCGEVFSMRTQNNGDFEFDEGTGCCEMCHTVFCENCGSWHTFGGKYEKICETCFNEKMLDDFAYWHDIFEDEYCDASCDDCPFFIKKGCMMILLDNLIDTAFHTEEVKKKELERLRAKNIRAVEEWRKKLHEQ